jgi:hypothetical protein
MRSNTVSGHGIGSWLPCSICLRLAFAAFALWAAPAQAAEPVLDIYGYDLQSDVDQIREWLAGEGFQPTETSTPGAEAYLRQVADRGEGFGFVPASRGLDDLFLNQNGITIGVDEVIRQLMATYGEPRDLEPAGRGYRLTYALERPGKPGQMVWVVQPGFVGVELSSTAYLSPSDSAGQWLEVALARLWSWRTPVLAVIGASLALFLLQLVLPVRIRRPLSKALQAVVYPILQVLGFFGSRIFTLLFGFMLIPLFVFSGCATMALATEQDTSWLWVLGWFIGVILALESRDSDEFRYVILADLIFVAMVAGVFLQMSLRASG